MTMFNPDDFINNVLNGEEEEKRRDLQGYDEATLRHMWRAEAITEEQWKAELVARGASAQQAATEIAIAKNVGLSTAAATKGQLTASEAAAVSAIKSVPVAAPSTPTPAAPPPVGGGLGALTGGLLGPVQSSALTGGPNFVGGPSPHILFNGQQYPLPAGTTEDSPIVQVTINDLNRKASASGQASGTPTSSAVQPSGGYGSQPSSAYKTSSSSGGGGSSASSSSAAPKAPPAPLRNSAADLATRGAVKVGSTPVLEGQQYRKVNEVVEAQDGQWYVVDPQGTPVSGPHPNQTQANTANVYSDLGPAVTSNKYAAIGEMAQQGANRPRISAGSGQDATISIDDIIGASSARGTEKGDFMGSLQSDYGPLDITKGGIADYGGLRDVSNADNDAMMYSGRTGTESGEIGIGASAIQQSGTNYGSQFHTALAPYLSQSQINRIDPSKYDQIALNVNALREQNLLNQADTDATKSYQASNYTALTGDPYEMDLLPEPMAFGGQIATGFGRAANMARQPMMSRPRMQQQPQIHPGGMPNPYANLGEVQTPRPAPPVSFMANGNFMEEDGPGRIMQPGQFGGAATPYAHFANGKWQPIIRKQNLAELLGAGNVWGNNPEEEENQPQNDIWRGLMDNAHSWYQGPAPNPQRDRKLPGMSDGGTIATGLSPEWQAFLEQEQGGAGYAPGVNAGQYGGAYTIDSGLIPGGGMGMLAGAGFNGGYAPEFYNPDPYKLIDPTSYNTYPWTPPPMAQGGKIVTGNEPMVVQGAWSGNPYATIGEPNALTGGQPTKEILDVKPMEPSVPMPVQQTWGRSPSAFSMVLEQMFGNKQRGRKQEYQKAW